LTVSARARQGGGVSRGRPYAAIVLAIALLAVAGATGAVVLRLNSDHAGSEPGLQIALLDWIVLSYVFSGLVAWWRRPENRFGPLMIAGGFLTLLSCLSSASAELPLTIGQAVDLLPFAVFLHVFLAFPSGRLRGRPERWLVGGGYVIAVGLEIVEMMLGGFYPENVLTITSHPDLAETLSKIQLTALAAIGLGGVGLLVARRRSDGPQLRRSSSVLVSSFILALLMLAVTFVMGAYFHSTAFLTVQRVTFFVVGVTPLAFLVALLDARLARASVGDLMVELRSDPPPGDLREPLARALNDPSLTLAYWLPEYGRWTDQDGHPLELPANDGDRAVTVVDRDGEHLAALIHDPSLADEPELLDGVSAVAGISLENGRLQAELKARLDELKGSRGRVIAAGQRERKRLERNLHDGAQQRLIALRLELGLLGDRLEGDPASRRDVEHARAEIGISLDELRAVARGLHPAVLSGHGLAVALESLAAASPVPVQLTVAVEGRLDEPTEVAAYYVVSESLANVGRHAMADSATVDVARRNGDLVVEIVDDGIGGADTERGSGLRGLADRVEALGGRLRVWTPRGGGTRVRAEMPCA
jgi:signal transduction histidine kinase